MAPGQRMTPGHREPERGPPDPAHLFRRAGHSLAASPVAVPSPHPPPAGSRTGTLSFSRLLPSTGHRAGSEQTCRVWDEGLGEWRRPCETGPQRQAGRRREPPPEHAACACAGAGDAHTWLPRGPQAGPRTASPGPGEGATREPQALREGAWEARGGGGGGLLRSCSGRGLGGGCGNAAFALVGGIDFPGKYRVRLRRLPAPWLL